MIEKKKPDFLCIGPERTGTSWLYYILRQHPHVWLPPLKELRYLNEGNLIPNHSPKQVFFSPHWHYRSVRQKLKQSLKTTFGRKGTTGPPAVPLAWMLRYSLYPRSFRWYAALFPSDTDRLCGDISPMYYHIPESKIQELSRHYPGIKIMIFIRNPIDRVWSKALLVLCRIKKHRFNEIPPGKFIRLFDDLYKEWTPYLETIALWKKYFTQVYTGFYDSLRDDPAAFSQDICRFLGIDKDLIKASLDTRINKGSGHILPLALYDYLYRQYSPEIDDIVRQFPDSYPGSWLLKK